MRSAACRTPCHSAQWSACVGLDMLEMPTLHATYRHRQRLDVGPTTSVATLRSAASGTVSTRASWPTRAHRTPSARSTRTGRRVRVPVALLEIPSATAIQLHLVPNAQRTPSVRSPRPASTSAASTPAWCRTPAPGRRCAPPGRTIPSAPARRDTAEIHTRNATDLNVALTTTAHLTKPASMRTA